VVHSDRQWEHGRLTATDGVCCVQCWYHAMRYCAVTQHQSALSWLWCRLTAVSHFSQNFHNRFWHILMHCTSSTTDVIRRCTSTGSGLRRKSIQNWFVVQCENTTFMKSWCKTCSTSPHSQIPKHSFFNRAGKASFVIVFDFVLFFVYHSSSIARQLCLGGP